MSFTWQEVWVCSHINVLVSNHLPLSWVPVHAAQAVQCTIWVLAMQMGPQHPVREQCLEPLGQQCAARVPQTSDHCSRAPQKQQVSVKGISSRDSKHWSLQLKGTLVTAFNGTFPARHSSLLSTRVTSRCWLFPQSLTSRLHRIACLQAARQIHRECAGPGQHCSLVKHLRGKGSHTNYNFC